MCVCVCVCVCACVMTDYTHAQMRVTQVVIYIITVVVISNLHEHEHANLTFLRSLSLLCTFSSMDLGQTRVFVKSISKGPVLVNVFSFMSLSIQKFLFYRDTNTQNCIFNGCK